MVSDYGSDSGWLPFWNSKIRVSALMEKSDQPFELLNSTQLGTGVNNWRWDLNTFGSFSISFLRLYRDMGMLPSESVQTPWNRFLPIKVNTFLWRLLLNMLSTRVNLHQKGV